MEASGITDDKLVIDYINLQPESFRKHRRALPLLKTLSIFSKEFRVQIGKQGYKSV